MNGRIHEGKTAAERLAAVARSIAVEIHSKFGRVADYADFQHEMEPFVEREMILVRIEEARHTGATGITQRIRELDKQLKKCERTLPVL